MREEQYHHKYGVKLLIKTNPEKRLLETDWLLWVTAHIFVEQLLVALIY